MSPSRAERREDVTARILDIGRRHLAEHGAAGLSLRAVTRDLGMVSSAVYRYVANRDELLTLLLVDSYGAQADAVDAAVATASDRRWDERLLAAARAFRAWAVAEPSRYALLYGSPVPGYAAPPEVTIEPGTRVIGVLLRLVGEGVAVGEIADAPAPDAVPSPLAEDLASIATEVGLARAPGRDGARAARLGDGGRGDEPGGVRAVRCRLVPGAGAGVHPAGADGPRGPPRPARPPLTSRAGSAVGQRPAATLATWARTTASTSEVGKGSR